MVGRYEPKYGNTNNNDSTLHFAVCYPHQPLNVIPAGAGAMAQLRVLCLQSDFAYCARILSRSGSSEGDAEHLSLYKRSMLDMAERLLTMRTAASTVGASKETWAPPVRCRVGHWQNRSAMAGVVV